MTFFKIKIIVDLTILEINILIFYQIVEHSK